MNIDKKHIKLTKTVGHLDSIPVDLVLTHGGFNILIMLKKNGESEILGVGPHAGVAKHQAFKKYPKIKWSDNG